MMVLCNWKKNGLCVIVPKSLSISHFFLFNCFSFLNDSHLLFHILFTSFSLSPCTISSPFLMNLYLPNSLHPNRFPLSLPCRWLLFDQHEMRRRVKFLSGINFMLTPWRVRKKRREREKGQGK